jgi:Bacterial Ig domain
VGTHSITAVYAGSGLFNASTSPALSQVISASATLKVVFRVHAMQDGTKAPKVATIPVPNAIVEVFSTSDACTGGMLSAVKPKKWGLIFDGADGPGGVDGCTPLSVGSYQATGVTDANGNATIIVPPLSLSLSNQYLVIARATNFDYIKTATSPDPLYSQYPVLSVAAGQTVNVPLALIATFNGKIVPGAQTEFFGSYLNIVQPEHMDWTNEQEQYPFVMVAEGGWEVSTNIAPPSGFATDATSISATVADQTTAVQFTLTDVGSDWTETGVTHVINHKGTTRVATSSVRMFNRRPTKAKADFWVVMTNSGATEIPVLHNDVVAPPKTLAITAVTQPANSSVTLVDGVVSYTPNAGFTGLDTFSYTITDSEV